jgi:hypothetical protein
VPQTASLYSDLGGVEVNDLPFASHLGKDNRPAIHESRPIIQVESYDCGITGELDV